MAKLTFEGNPLKTYGDLPKIGDKAPNFSLVKNDLTDIKLNDILGKKILLNIFPSIDTEICAISSKTFNEKMANHNNIEVLCVSMDLPFAQGKFCGTENTKNITTVSAFRNPEFGKDYGVVITEGPLRNIFSRAIILINEQKEIIYTEHVSELTNEPNYENVMKII